MPACINQPFSYYCLLSDGGGDEKIREVEREHYYLHSLVLKSRSCKIV